MKIGKSVASHLTLKYNCTLFFNTPISKKDFYGIVSHLMESDCRCPWTSTTQESQVSCRNCRVLTPPRPSPEIGLKQRRNCLTQFFCVTVESLRSSLVCIIYRYISLFKTIFLLFSNPKYPSMAVCCISSASRVRTDATSSAILLCRLC